MIGDRSAARRCSSVDPRNPTVSILGKLPSRADFVQYGLVDEPERVFRAWLEQAVLIAGGVLPSRAVRFVVAPRRTPMFGVWIPSHDALGRPFPLVFMRRLSCSDGGNGRATGARDLRVLGDLPWTLILAGCAHYLTTAESCLMLGRSNSAAGLWASLEALPLPSQRDLLELWSEASRSMESEQLDTFAARNLAVAASGEEFLSAVRRLGPALHARATGDGPAQDQGSMLAVPAAHEFDVFAWLELLRVQRDPGMTPRSLFWSPADRRALVSLGAPLQGTLAFLRQPRVNAVQRLPLVNEPDESPAIESELRRLVRRCLTLSKLRSALSGDRHDAGRPPPLPKKDPRRTAETKQPQAPLNEPAPHAHAPASHGSVVAAPQAAAPKSHTAPPASGMPHDSWYDAEPQPLEKFRNVPAPRSHFPGDEYPPDLAKRFAREPQFGEQPQRPAHAPPTEPLSVSFVREPPPTQPRAQAQARRPIRFRIPDPPIHLSDTDAIEYVFALVRERERAEEERERAERRCERVDADKTVTEPARAEQPCADSQRLGPRAVLTHEHDRAERPQECAELPRTAQLRDGERQQPIHERQPAIEERTVAERASAVGEPHDPQHTTLHRQLDCRPTNLELEEHLLERERRFTRREYALEEREREVRRREVAVHARERQLRERERAVRHGERARRISQTFEIRAPTGASVRVLDPITVVQGRSGSATRGLVNEPARLDPPPRTTVQHLRSCTRVLEPITLVDDGSIRAARVLMIE